MPLQAEFGLSRADASSPVLILYLGAGHLRPDRRQSPGPVCHPPGDEPGRNSVLFRAGDDRADLASIPVMALALLLPAALGYLVLGMLNTATLVSRWFFRHRGLAFGIAAVATSGGGLVTPFLGQAIRHYGWRSALMI